MSFKKKLLIIGAGWEQLPLIEEIKNNGYFIIATHPSLNAEGFKIADQFYVKDSRDISAHLNIAITHKIDAIITDNCDYSLYTASIIAAKLNIPSTSIESALLSNDKFAQRKKLDNGRIKQPLFVKIQTIEQLEEAIPKIGFPSILKPIDSRGTFGVSKINSIIELESAFFDAINNSPSRTLIYEQFIDGILVTVDGFCFSNGHRSLTVASRKFEKGLKPITKEIIYPAEFDKQIKENLMQNHHDVVTCLNYNFGHTHGEYILTKNNEIFLVECTNRGGGVYTSTVIVPLLTKINTNQLLLNQTLGLDNFITDDLSVKFMTQSVMLTFLDFEVGSVIKSMNIEEMNNMPYVVKFRTKYSVNDMVETITNGAGRHSMLVIKGKNHADLLKNIENFKEEFKIYYH